MQSQGKEDPKIGENKHSQPGTKQEKISIANQEQNWKDVFKKMDFIQLNLQTVTQKIKKLTK